MRREALLAAVAAFVLPVQEARGGFPSGSPGEASPSPPAKSSIRKPAAPGVAWLSLQEGLAVVREKYLPAILVYEPGEREAAEAGQEPAESKKGVASPVSLVEDASLRRTLKGFVCVRLWAADLAAPYPLPEGDRPEPRTEAGKDPRQGPVPGEGPSSGSKPGAAPGRGAELPSAGERLGLAAGAPSLVILSFREEVVARHDGDLPTRTRLGRELRRIAIVNGHYAAAARQAEKAIHDSRYAAGLKRQRDAVRLILKYDDTRVQETLDSVTKEEIVGLIGEYKEAARKAMRSADVLEGNGKYEQAIKEYDAVMAAYPFTDILKFANRRKNEILRKMTFGW